MDAHVILSHLFASPTVHQQMTTSESALDSITSGLLESEWSNFPSTGVLISG
jgi:hypothetical protein